MNQVRRVPHYTAPACCTPPTYVVYLNHSYKLNKPRRVGLHSVGLHSMHCDPGPKSIPLAASMQTPPREEPPESQMPQLRVCAIVVTYNRARLLERCLRSLGAQLREPDTILVVDNASTDTTSALLDEWPKVEALRLPNNEGGAGGFARGIYWAIERGFDWVWLLDDDGLPAEDALEVLLQRASNSQFGILGPLVVAEHSEENLAFRLRHTDSVAAVTTMAKNGLLTDEVNAFNGTLIRSDVVTRIGTPKREMFIWGDEVEYVLRARRNGVKIATVVGARYVHPAEQGRTLKLLGGLLGHAVMKPTHMAHIYVRNQGYLDGRYRGLLSSIRSLVRLVYLNLVVNKGDLRGLARSLRYYRDGYVDHYRLPR